MFNRTCCLGRQSTAKKDKFCRSLKREDRPFPSFPEMASTPFVPDPPPPSFLPASAPSERPPRPLPVTPVTSSFALTARHSCGSDSSVGAASSPNPEFCLGSDAGRASCSKQHTPAHQQGIFRFETKTGYAFNVEEVHKCGCAGNKETGRGEREAQTEREREGERDGQEIRQQHTQYTEGERDRERAAGQE